MFSKYNRRDFLKHTTLVSASLWLPKFLQGFNQTKVNRDQTNGKVLVIIQLSGGNDGLNTIVPFRQDEYYSLRPRLAIPKNELLTLNDDLGFHPALAALQDIYGNGNMSIVNSVGYPNPNRSHFRSMDIWQTASDANEYLSTGWLGRYLDAQCSGNCNQIHEAIEVDGTLSLAMKGKERKGMSISNIQKLYRTTKQKVYQDITAHGHHMENDPTHLGYLYKTVVETAASTEYIYQKSKIYRSTQPYPAHKFGKHLKMIAELIVADIDTSVFYVSLGGFDTHVNQKGQQQRLLKIYADSVAAFTKDLQQNNRFKDVLVMTFSEFGRRVAQNASNGTDHGTANNVFLMGGNLRKAGLYNPASNLANLSKGDLQYEIDFREIYTTILQDWLRANANAILGKHFPTLGIL